ncbi:MAG: DUF4189 domain-containing protein [Chthoniobacter sp.]|uniref:DUF4189 domain-containing protein n=1 Tax=Chthoniobacter sp. TaxID=2510640 RepID=UPI0032AC3C7A
MNCPGTPLAGIARAGIALRWSLALLLVTPLGLLPSARAEETYEERLARTDRERQSQRDLEDYMDRWRANRAACQFSAIAYSQSTKRWGYAWGKESRAAAERAAIRYCQSPDAEALCWAKGGWYCAFAVGPKSYGSAMAATAEEAQAKALKFGNDVAGGCRIVLCFGGEPIKVIRVD